jgi:hypothetical protein
MSKVKLFVLESHYLGESGYPAACAGGCSSRLRTSSIAGAVSVWWWIIFWPIHSWRGFAQLSLVESLCIFQYGVKMRVSAVE